MAQETTKIAFIGAGNMGAGMAGCLLDAGHSLSLYNRTAEKAETLVQLGASLATTAKEAATGADAVIAIVADDEALKRAQGSIEKKIPKPNFNKISGGSLPILLGDCKLPLRLN